MTVILDGGMGGELIRREVIPRGELWSAQALLDAPDTVLAVHADYIAAGAGVITTNSYSTVKVETIAFSHWIGKGRSIAFSRSKGGV